MNRALRGLGSVVLLLALAACASAPKPGVAPAAAEPVAGQAAGSGAPPVAAAESAAAPVDAAVATPPVAVAAPVAEPAVDDAAVSAEDGASATPTAAEDDYAALYGEVPAAGTPEGSGAAAAPAPFDPWEPMNRRIHAFNTAVDNAIARPLAQAYATVVPQPMRLGVANFFDNLSSPLTFVNQLLQGRPRHAVQTLGRFVVNSTLGIGGIFDPASDLKMKRRSEDFGQTLGIWGWRSSRYVELPLFGPRTVRDVFGLVGDAPLSVTRQVDDDTIRYGLQGLQLVDKRSQLLSLDAMRQDASDEYALVRNAWMQRRTFQIEGDRRRREQSDGLPDYLEEEDPYPTVPADAMPVPIPGG
ncbi:MlaA family lipoprotein [Pseudoxanthomonas kaohsiungensis]|uniref:VacJ family lipoprotein n=1 Tax=Pseudoxanthomonas kaohsiungensis TaxID=283923 RepID=A0ABW3LWQ0_9GAMM|nr:VacJ family lipoprotein [Pseudoxanthomonas kaohsiungensis]KAF1704623.1 hypothetical protein CSC66_03335 [Pseudoxanthomonas kaohsiungensis]